jgi:hypothetical protein
MQPISNHCPIFTWKNWKNYQNNRSTVGNRTEKLQNISLYNAIVMVLSEIMSAHALITGVLILPVGGSANNSLSAVNHRHLPDTFLFRRVFCISSVLDIMTPLRVRVAQSFFFFNSHSAGGGTESTRHAGRWMAYCTCPGWLWWWWRILWNEDWQGKPKYSEKTCPRTTLPTTNPTCQTRARTWTAVVGSQLLTTWAMPRTSTVHSSSCILCPGGKQTGRNNIVPCWRYLLGFTDSATQPFTLFLYLRLHRRYYTTVELELSNSRTVELSTLELSYSLTICDWLFSTTLRLLD